MKKSKYKEYSKNFGKKEKILNYSCQTYQLSRPNKVGPVMELIREYQPRTFEKWEEQYFKKAYTKSKDPVKITPKIIKELGERLHTKITEIVIPEWESAFRELSLQDCIDYIYNLVLNRTYDGFNREKSVIYDDLAKKLTTIKFSESDSDLDHAGDIDYLGFIDESMEKAFGIQIKPITAKANFGNYSLSKRMAKNFRDFEKKYFGKVFILFSKQKEIANPEIIEEIKTEIERLKDSKK